MLALTQYSNDPVSVAHEFSSIETGERIQLVFRLNPCTYSTLSCKKFQQIYVTNGHCC